MEVQAWFEWMILYLYLHTVTLENVDFGMLYSGIRFAQCCFREQDRNAPYRFHCSLP